MGAQQSEQHLLDRLQDSICPSEKASLLSDLGALRLEQVFLRSEPTEYSE